MLEWYFKHVARAQQFYSEIACVASVPVRAERNIRPREGVFTFGTRGKWGKSKTAARYFVRLVWERLLRRQFSGKICDV